MCRLHRTPAGRDRLGSWDRELGCGGEPPVLCHTGNDSGLPVRAGTSGALLKGSGPRRGPRGLLAGSASTFLESTRISRGEFRGFPVGSGIPGGFPEKRRVPRLLTGAPRRTPREFVHRRSIQDGRRIETLIDDPGGWRPGGGSLGRVRNRCLGGPDSSSARSRLVLLGSRTQAELTRPACRPNPPPMDESYSSSPTSTAPLRRRHKCQTHKGGRVSADPDQEIP
jgi:hypothetical protein